MNKYIDLFAGCGGLTDGFEQTGLYEGVAHVEWEKYPVSTLVNRLRSKWGYSDSTERVLRFDIQRIDDLINGWNDPVYGASKGLKFLCKKKSKIDVLIGGPPCQAYSIAGRIRDANKMHDDYRNYLFESYIDIMKWSKPDVFVFENVAGILSAKPGGIPIISRIKNAFEKAGYITIDNYKESVFMLEAYGVPQKRTRIIIVGLRKSTFGNVSQTKQKLYDFYSNFEKQFKTSEISTAKQALQGLTKFYPLINSGSGLKNPSHGPLKTKYLNHIPRFHSQRDIEIFKLLTNDIKSGNNRYTSVAALKTLYTKYTGRVSNVHKYHVICPNLPCNTIPAHLYKDGLRHIHWDTEQARSLTVREAARIQGFDDDFEFLGSMGEQYKMIGNAVPPIFAKKLALAINQLLQKRD